MTELKPDNQPTEKNVFKDPIVLALLAGATAAAAFILKIALAPVKSDDIQSIKQKKSAD